MATIINKTEEILSQVKSEIMNKPEDLEMFEKIDEIMEEVHRDYLIKEANSWISAGKCYVFQNYN